MFHIYYNEFTSPSPIFGTIFHLPEDSCPLTHTNTPYLKFSLSCVVPFSRMQFLVFVSEQHLDSKKFFKGRLFWD